MTAYRCFRTALLAATLAASGALFTSAHAGEAAAQFEPSVGQEGKDVVWVPTSQALVDRMLDLAKLTPNDIHMDLGSGDGRTVITAAKRGARSTGIEYNPDMVALSQRNAAKEGVSDKATFMKADLFETDFSKATVITLFLLPDINIRLRPKILDMKPGTRVVSNSFTMGEWKADQTVTAEKDCTTYCTAYLWIVPAKVEGSWQFENGEVTLSQSFQMVTGSVKAGGKASPVNGKLNGDQISFTAGGAQYTGKVSGNTIQGTVKSGANASPWRATRVSSGAKS